MAKIKNAQNHREAIDIIRESKTHYTRHSSEMSAYEANGLKAEIDAFQDQWRPTIEAGVMGEFKGAVNNYLAAKTKAAAAKGRELARWDNAEGLSLQAMTKERIKTDAARLNSWDGIEPFKALMKEAEAGGIDQKRAVYEVLRGLTNLVPEGIRMEANRLATEADKKLQELRVTDEMREAEAGIEDAKNSVKRQYQDVVQSAAVLGDNITGAFAGTYTLGKEVYKTLTEADPELADVFFNIPPRGTD